MPFDGTDLEVGITVCVLELMEEWLQEGRMWVRGRMFAAGGRTCLLGAHDSVARRFDDKGKGGRALHYLAQAIEPKGRGRRTRRWILATIVEFNDNCAAYNDIERVLHRAQELARADAASTATMDCGCFEKITHAKFDPAKIWLDPG